MRCPNCQFDNADDARFCSNCGATLPTGRMEQGGAPPPAQPTYAQGYQNPPYPAYQPYYGYPVTPTKDPGIAAIIALVGGLFGFMGLGHIYVGRVLLGILILIAGIALWIFGVFALFIGVITFGAGSLILILVFAIAAIVLFVWQVYDAYRLAKDYNDIARQTGRAPW